MSDSTPNAPKKPIVRRERGAARPAAPSVEALASVVREAETAKPAQVEPPAPRPVAEAKPTAEPKADAKPEPRPEAKTEPTAIALAPATRPVPRGRVMPLVREHGPLAAALAMAVGLGWVSGLATMIHLTPAPEVPPAPAALVLDPGMSAPLAIRTQGQEAGRVAAELKAVSGAVASLRASVEGIGGDQAARLARLERAEAEAAARLQGIAERVAAAKDGEVQLAQVLERLDRMERAPAATVQAASLPAPVVAAPVPAPVTPVPAPVPAPAVTGSLPEARATAAAPPPAETRPAEKAPERVEIVPGWYLRGVHRGTALVEGRRGLVEVRAGEVIPGIGRVEAIERRGREWVVVTARGLIATESW